MSKHRIKAVSLFANVGIAETYLSEIGIDVIVANEIDPRRVALYRHLYPDTKMIEGDITSEEIKDQIVTYATENGVELLLATPPCQGMSTAGKMDKWDVRNTLICHAIEMVKRIRPKYVFLENVPQQLTTKIKYNGEDAYITTLYSEIKQLKQAAYDAMFPGEPETDETDEETSEGDEESEEPSSVTAEDTRESEDGER